MSDTFSDADKIRSKRLAKLGATSRAPQREDSSEAAPAEKSSSSSYPRLAPQQNGESPRLQSTKGARESVSSLLSQQSHPEGKRTMVTPAPPVNSGPNLRGPGSSNMESIEAFEDRTLCAIFKFTLNEGQSKDIKDPRLVYLPGLRGELESEGSEIRMETTILDQALLEAASNAQRRPLDYLLPCWKRVSKIFRGFRRSSDDDPKFNIICEARRLCLSYCIFAITMPEMFGVESAEHSPLKSYLLLDPESERGIDPELLNETAQRFDEDENIKPAFIAAIELLSQELASMSITDDYKPYVMALRNLVGNSTLAAAITESSMFNSSQDPSTFETRTLLGPWFRLSPLQGNATLQYFSNPKTKGPSQISSSQQSLRMMQRTLNTDLLDIINRIIRASKDARERILDWFATALNINHKRRAMQVDPAAVSSDGFVFNLTTCLDQLCEPFMDAEFTKIDRIDSQYLHRNPRVDMKHETKINADQHASEAFYAKRADGTNNFITEIFFLTAAAHHYGSESLTSKLEQLDRDVRHLESMIDKFEAERSRLSGNPFQLQAAERVMKVYKDRVDLALALKYSLQGVLFDAQWQSRSMLFTRYVLVWLLRLVSGVNFPKERFELPLPEQPSEVFQCLPEYFLDDIISNFKFITWSMPHIITATQGDELVMLCITFLECTAYIKNPYLKAGLVSILFRGTWPRPGGARGILVDLLNSMPFANDYLLHALMRFYIEAEHTGAHTQFYDKFNIRYEIFQIIKSVWSNSLYRRKLSDQADENLDFFVQFVNLLLNDVTYVLDESFGAFSTIHNIQSELRLEGATMDPAARQEKEDRLASVQRSAKSYMQLTNETVAMLKLFTEALADSFTMPEIVQRLADMLDYNLDTMVGPKQLNLQVENAAEYGFNPRALLSEIVDVYLNLMNKESFIVAIARDGRSYKPENFRKASEIMRTKSLKPVDDLKKWERIQKKVKEAKEADDQAEEDLGEIPDELLDPLMFTLMEDPVILPASQVSVDRATIRSHLLSDPNDPFNRAPLKIEDVIPNTKLKEEIEKFKASRMAARRQAAVHQREEQMDTSAD